MAKKKTFAQHRKRKSIAVAVFFHEKYHRDTISCDTNDILTEWQTENKF